MGQTAELAPADKKLYALRDVTATVDQMALIASSIMSKKLAAGADAIVLDVKTGSGAFMKTEEDSRALALEMVKIGQNAGRRCVAVISNMDEPLGYAVGNALEVQEAIDTLRGNGPEDLYELCLTLGSQMLLCGGKVTDAAEGRKLLEETIASGAALDKFAEFVKAQGGDSAAVYDTDLLPKASIVRPILSTKEGTINHIMCDEIGVCSLILGGGRETKTSEIDLSVGLVLQKKVGDFVKVGDTLAIMHANDEAKAAACEERFLKAYTITEEKTKKPALIRDIIDPAK
jgi:pyrimidine-nucleoside phosphorylase